MPASRPVSVMMLTVVCPLAWDETLPRLHASPAGLLASAPPPLHTAEGKKRAFVLCYPQRLRDDIADFVNPGHTV